MITPPTTTADWLCYFLRSGIADMSAGSETIDWTDLLRLAQRHGVAPLLYHRLTTAGLQEHVPQDIFHTLHRSYLHNAARNMRLYHELAHILSLFNEHHIPVIVLKGAYLAEAVYGNIALRTMCDIDLLVHKPDLARTQHTLREHGYLRKNARVPIDMQWTLDLSIANLPIDMNEAWERATPGRLAGVEVYALSPEDLLLHLCIHLAFHHDFHGAGLRAFCDMQTTIHRYSDAIHWAHLTELAATWQARHAAYVTLAFADEMVAAESIPTSQNVSPPQPLTFTSSVSWPDLLHLAQRHGVAPLLYYRLKTTGLQEHVPQDIFATSHYAPLSLHSHT